MKNEIGLYIVSKGESPKAFGLTKEEAFENWKKDFLSMPFNKTEANIIPHKDLNVVQVDYPNVHHMRVEYFEINFVAGIIPPPKKDLITFLEVQEFCSCEYECDCEPEISYTIRVNGQTGYGYGMWVSDNHNNDILAVKFLGSEFECKDYEEMFLKIEITMSAFKNVEVEKHLSLV